MDNLRLIWNNLTSGYTGDDKLVAELWAELEKNYTATGRHYHNLNHLLYMMEVVIPYKANLKDPDTVFFSIFYHDIIYDPARTDNEETSANIAGDRLSRLQVPPGQIIKCKDQILATKNHKDNKDIDTNYLVDFDLAILGDITEKYNDYAKKIRKEYSISSDYLYNKGRIKVLKHYLNRDRIFNTARFFDKHENQARENLAAELAKILLD